MNYRDDRPGVSHGGKGSAGAERSRAESAWNRLRFLPRAVAGIARNLGCLWIFLLPLLIGGGWLFRNTYDVLLKGNPGWNLLIQVGVGLAIVGLCFHFVLGAWREWREAEHNYQKPPGAYRSAWRTERLSATWFPSSINSWLGHLLATTLTWSVVLVTLGVIGFALAPAITSGVSNAWWILLALLAVVGVFGFFAWRYSVQLYRAVRHRLAYDRATFVIDQLPAVLGGTVSGTVETGMSPSERPQDEFNVSLVCYERKEKSRERSISYYPHWRSETQASGFLAPGGEEIHLSVSFDLPEDQPPSTIESLSNCTLWCLNVSVDSGSPAYEQSIEIPVFPAHTE